MSEAEERVSGPWAGFSGSLPLSVIRGRQGRPRVAASAGLCEPLISKTFGGKRSFPLFSLAQMKCVPFSHFWEAKIY